MEAAIHQSLPSLANDLQFRVEKITPLDFLYTDGTAVGSFLKLIVVRKDSQVTLYFYPSGKYIPMGFLTREEQSILDGWLATVMSKKIESV